MTKNQNCWVKIWHFQRQRSFVVSLVSQHGGIANFAPSHQFDIFWPKASHFCHPKGVLGHFAANYGLTGPSGATPNQKLNVFYLKRNTCKNSDFWRPKQQFCLSTAIFNQIMHTGYSYNRASTGFICNLQKIDFKIPSTALNHIDLFNGNPMTGWLRRRKT